MSTYLKGEHFPSIIRHSKISEGGSEFSFGYHDKKTVEGAPSEFFRRIGGLTFVIEPPLWEMFLMGVVLDWDGERFSFKHVTDEAREREFKISARAAEGIAKRQADDPDAIPRVFGSTKREGKPPRLGLRFQSKKMLDHLSAAFVQEIGEFTIAFDEPSMWEEGLAGMMLDWDGQRFSFVRATGEAFAYEDGALGSSSLMFPKS